jgi:hypothetical protein
VILPNEVWLAIICGSIGLALELVIGWLRPLWFMRRVLAGFALCLTLFAAGLLAAYELNVASLLLLFIALYRGVNDLRVVEGRQNDAKLRRVFRRTVWVLALSEGLAAGGWVFWHAYIHLSLSHVLPVIAGMQAVVALVLLLVTLRNLAQTRHRPATKHYTDKELPTVSVCIPARNETDDLEQCLQSVLASDYPKLEVLVLDDCSQNLRTSEIIRALAHDGVRFIAGEEPADRWLAKNQAYEALLEQASGEYVLFCGVDARFGPHAIRALVNEVLERRKVMLSVLPGRRTGSALSGIIQPIRYWWELSLPRKAFNRPPVLSTCWLASREFIREKGGFKAVMHAILPEVYFAREAVRQDGYAFMRHDTELAVETVKSLHEQRTTAVRMRYPQVRQRPELVLLLSLAEVSLLFGPFAVLLAGFWLGFNLAQLLAVFACLLLLAVHILILYVSDPAAVWHAPYTLPFALLTEVVLGNVSMARYEFGTVLWKDRNVCLPVMGRPASLPKKH